MNLVSFILLWTDLKGQQENRVVRLCGTKLRYQRTFPLLNRLPIECKFNLMV